MCYSSRNIVYLIVETGLLIGMEFDYKVGQIVSEHQEARCLHLSGAEIGIACH